MLSFCGGWSVSTWVASLYLAIPLYQTLFKCLPQLFCVRASGTQSVTFFISLLILLASLATRFQSVVAAITRLKIGLVVILYQTISNGMSHDLSSLISSFLHSNINKYKCLYVIYLCVIFCQRTGTCKATFCPFFEWILNEKSFINDSIRLSIDVTKAGYSCLPATSCWGFSFYIPISCLATNKFTHTYLYTYILKCGVLTTFNCARHKVELSVCALRRPRQHRAQTSDEWNTHMASPWLARFSVVYMKILLVYENLYFTIQ